MKSAQKAFRPKIPNLQNSEKSQPDFLDRNEFRTSCLILDELAQCISYDHA